jgi:hypothetical protein
MRISTHTRLFVFSVALIIQLLAALMFYQHPDHAIYLPHIATILSGVLVCSLLRSNLVLNTFLLGILLAIGAGVDHWMAWKMGFKLDWPGVDGAYMLAISLLPLTTSLCAVGGCVAMLVRRLLRSRVS